MKKLFTPLLICLVLLSSCAHKFESADMVVHNATIYSVDEGFTTHQAMAIKDGIIIDMGPEREILNKYNYDVEVDAQTRPVYPGLIDAHCHFYGYGISLTQVNLVGTTSYEDVVEKTKKHYEKFPTEWVQGRGWDQNDWEIKEFPNKDQLDAAFPDIPVILRRVDGHAAIANSEALKLAGITSGGPIPGGLIEVKDSVLTGILIDNAVDSVMNIIPDPSEEENRNALLLAQDNCFAYGLTTVDDAGLDKNIVELIQQMHESNELKMRIYAMLSDTKENLDHYILNGQIKTDRLNVSSFKFYGDGALGSRGACLKEPYSDKHGHYGFLLNDIEHFETYAKALHNNGWQMNTHCIGDSTNRLLLDIYAKILGGQNDRRWRIEHAQVVSVEDMEMFYKYSIVPSVQPTHATSDMPWAQERVGDHRIDGAYAYRMLMEQNGWIPLGTDFPVEHISPFKTFYAAVFRSKPENGDHPAYLEDNALTREQALRGMTIWAAMSNLEEKEKGSLEIGKKADFVILDRDIMTAPQNKLLQVNVVATYIGGELVYSF